MEFSAYFDPDETIRAAVAAAYPDNVFCSDSYAKVIGDTDHRLAFLASGELPGRRVEGCYAQLQFGRLTRSLEIISLPKFRDVESFFSGFESFCRQQQIRRLSINTFGSPPEVIIPSIGWGQVRSARFEFLLDLANVDLLGGLSSNHKRNRKKAIKAGMQIASSTERAAVDAHLGLMNASIDRRAGRGEDISNESDADKYWKFMRSGAGCIYQARLAGEVVSSILVLRSAAGAYYHSAGTSPDGMRLGASVFLISELADALRADGCTVFNLGGTDPDQEGLRRFKAGFGAITVPLESSQSFFGNKLRQKLVTAYQRLRADAV